MYLAIQPADANETLCNTSFEGLGNALILSKMPIFASRGKIDCGIEIVPMKSLSTGNLAQTVIVEQETTGYRMPTGVSYFE